VVRLIVVILMATLVAVAVIPMIEQSRRASAGQVKTREQEWLASRLR